MKLPVWLRISWGMTWLKCHDLLCNYFFIRHSHRQKWWDLLPGKMLLSAWLEMCFRNVLQSFWKLVPLGFSKSLFYSKGSCLPAQAFCRFPSLPDSHNTHLWQVIIIAERKTETLAPGPRKGWMTECSSESVFPESQPCAHYWFKWCRKYLYHYWQALTTTK